MSEHAAPHNVAIATLASRHPAAVDDRYLVAALAARGIAAEMAVWDDPGVDWGRFDLCIVRSTWDYDRPYRIAAFRAWIDHVAERTLLWNPPEVLRWNLDKRYLRDLAARGVPVPESVWLERGARASLAAILAEHGWREAVVKPVVSASARETMRVARDELVAAQRRLEENLAREAMMVQAFLPEVVSRGELSLMFIDGAFTHAVHKRPAAGDFRVQIEHGGSEVRMEPEPAVVAAGERVLRAVGDATLPYARVDLVPRDAGEPLLLELELVEPSLFLGLCPQAAERLADAAVAAMGRG